MTPLATFIVTLHTRPGLGDPFSGAVEVVLPDDAPRGDIAFAARRQAFARGYRVGVRITSIERADAAQTR